MRFLHNQSIVAAIALQVEISYDGGMKKSIISRIPVALAVAVLLTILGLWFGTGAHLGWTQTSVVEMHLDEITGIDYPVRRSAFVAGVDMVAGGLIVSAAIAGLGLVSARLVSKSR